MGEGDLGASDLDDVSEQEESAGESDLGASINSDDDVTEQEKSADEESDVESVDAPESNSLDDTVTEAQLKDTSDLSTKEHSRESSNNQPAPINTQSQYHPSSTRKSTQIKPDTTIPTNAYYRFLVRRGPKGHILASFSLVSIQWIHTYLPFLYKFAASILLTLRIYDPNLLHIKERARLEREERRMNKVSFTDKLRGTFSSNNGTKKKKQREDDQVATSKLQQLFKTAKTASLDWKEIRYSYLSVDFRRRHGLGGEYVTKKPVKFMGERVGGELNLENYRYNDDEEVVFDEDRLSLEQDVVVQGQMLDQTMKKQHKRKRKLITDWVVQSFANRHFASTITINKSKAGSSNNMHSPATVPPSLTAIWKSVQKDAILNAAWESRSAEKSIWTNDNDNRGIQHNSPSSGKSSSNKMHRSSTITNDKPSNQSSGSASKMFQSVMTRVGSNGRLLGAYPMDALPIAECCHRRGVIELARRYGYGDWNVNEKNWEENGVEEEADDEMWGGGDLFFENDVNENVDYVSTLRHGNKSGKEKRRSDNDAEVPLKPNKSRSRRRRKKPQQKLL
jgi:hypothetical protein